jgi:hypothetical protein
MKTNASSGCALRGKTKTLSSGPNELQLIERNRMTRILHLMAACLIAMFIVSTQASAAPMMGQSIAVEAHVIPIAGGCGPNGWRGPYGGCRYTPYYGPLPGGYYQEAPVMGNGCPPGYWRGPWGHCRNTPYHGNLPGGGWKP